MRSSDFGFILYAEGEEYKSYLSPPEETQTVWGPAVRADQADKLVWEHDVYISLSRPNELRKRLPLERLRIEYTSITVTGPYFSVLYEIPIRNRARSLGAPSKVSRLVDRICSCSATWAIFVLDGWELIEQTYSVGIEQACSLIDTFLYESSPELDCGFEVFSP